MREQKCKAKESEQEDDLEFEVILREFFFRFFYALINISRTRPGILHSIFTMEFRVKIKQDMIKGNFLLCRNMKGPPTQQPGENRKGIDSLDQSKTRSSATLFISE